MPGRIYRTLFPVIGIVCLFGVFGCTPVTTTATATTTQTSTTTSVVTAAPVTVTAPPVTNTIINTSTTTLYVVPVTTTADITTMGFTSANPADILMPITTNIGTKGEIPGVSTAYNVVISVSQVIRGALAWVKLENLNMNNKPPPDGYDYILAKVRFEYLKGPYGQTSSYDVYSDWFTAVSASGEDYANPKIVGPTPTMNKLLYPGEILEGWLVLQVSQADAKPLLTIGRNAEGKGGLWFKLY